MGVRGIAVFALLLLAGCTGGVLDAQGPVGAADRQMMLNALAIMLAIALPTIVLAFVAAWWFRASNPRARRRPHWVYSGRIELVVWSIPLLVILFLAGVIWVGSHRVDPYRPISNAKPLDVQVVSLDWKWLFIYPQEGIATVNELTLPEGVPVHFFLTSASVMNAFFVPQLGSMVATMNGMVTQLYLQADHPGDYYAESTQFSGDGFSGMNFVVHAVPPERFRQWVGSAHASGPALDRTSYEALARESMNVRPFTYRAVEPGLFQAIATQQIAPQAGPRHGRGGVGVNPRGD
ncbi:MAG TPA: ubiquinol oxidase subunit II [Ramlibacter sp.]|nr:ubiquinol oxidase subunit II [Ramlibacter sp.]